MGRHKLTVSDKRRGIMRSARLRGLDRSRVSAKLSWDRGYQYVSLYVSEHTLSGEPSYSMRVYLTQDEAVAHCRSHGLDGRGRVDVQWHDKERDKWLTLEVIEVYKTTMHVHRVDPD